MAALPMASSPLTGRTLAHYRVAEKIGAGGMGEVYRAQDTKLGREVAVKVLPEAFARDPDRMARFEREARLLASLNHPNIAAIFGLEESDGLRFLVLELVPGRTLNEHLAADSHTLEEKLGLARQIAEALEAAHEKGIIHRDLKPANVKVTPEGKVKVLDFGLAKAFAGDSGAVDVTQSPTMSDIASRHGVILGTAAYMSPEQARGKPVDKRTDIWAYGCVLFEILSSQMVFRGDTVSDVVAGILRGEPNWEALQSDTPPRVRDLLRRCLQKDPARRLRDIADARFEIEDTLAAPAAETAAPHAAPRPSAWQRALPWGAAAVAGLLVGVLVWFLKPGPSSGTSEPTRVALSLPANSRPAFVRGQVALAISPDGRQVVYTGLVGAQPRLLRRSLDSYEVSPIAGGEGGSGPFFSPDGRWIGFSTPGYMKKIPAGGGSPIALCPTSFIFGASWTSDGTIVFGQSATSGLWRVSADGGKAEPLTEVDLGHGEISHRWPVVLPDNKTVLFTVVTGGGVGEWRIDALSLATGQRRTLIQGGTQPQYSPTGHLVFLQPNGVVAAVPFDAERVEVTGPPFPALEGIAASELSFGTAHFALAQDGTLAYLPGTLSGPERTLVWVDRKGTSRPVSEVARAFETPRLSPDGRQVAVTSREVSADLWTLQLGQDNLVHFTFDPAEEETPVWSPDGKRLAYSAIRGTKRVILWRLADGSASEEQLLEGPGHSHVTDWSRDGRLLLYEQESSAENGWDIWVLPLEGERKPLLLLGSNHNERWPVLSPDGRWMAYLSDESGRPEVYVQAFPRPGGKWQVSTGGGGEPVWARNGRELYYRNGYRLMVAPVQTGPVFTPGKAQVLFEWPYEAMDGIRPNYDVTPEGQQFLMIKAIETSSTPTQINLILNWSEELKRRDAAQKK
ncbi:MAG TPA: protein kinase [Candidatus Acidoferrales bacterium]|nr:protein kinase [Candidatus Acidoferrales bacterium]